MVPARLDLASRAEGAAYADAMSEYALPLAGRAAGGGSRSRRGYFESRLKTAFDQK